MKRILLMLIFSFSVLNMMAQWIFSRTSDDSSRYELMNIYPKSISVDPYVLKIDKSTGAVFIFYATHIMAIDGSWKRNGYWKEFVLPVDENGTDESNSIKYQFYYGENDGGEYRFILQNKKTGIDYIVFTDKIEMEAKKFVWAPIKLYKE